DHSVKLPIGLQNLFVSDPAISMDDGDGDVVYLTARQKYMHPKSWVLAVDTRNRKCQVGLKVLSNQVGLGIN
uniref:Uncharacterized protein n=1 Tax=Aegilops tauschii subsp. strangulata TaxID=200361 RepID=A0A453CNA2_AEGTS